MFTNLQRPCLFVFARKLLVAGLQTRQGIAASGPYVS
jgi:hypothetical protein